MPRILVTDQRPAVVLTSPSTSEPQSQNFSFSVTVIGSDSNQPMMNITTLFSCPGSPTSTHTVQRFLSDFEWINRRLKVESPGVVIPAVPTLKKLRHLEQTKLVLPHSFLQRNIQRFLEKCGAHRLLQTNDGFQAFLQMSGEQWKNYVDQNTKKRQATTNLVGESVLFLRKALIGDFSGTTSSKNAVSSTCEGKDLGNSPKKEEMSPSLTSQDYLDNLVAQGSSNEFFKEASALIRNSPLSDTAHLSAPQLVINEQYYMEHRLDNAAWENVGTVLQRSISALESYRNFFECLIHRRREDTQALSSVGGVLKKLAICDRDFHSSSSTIASLLTQIAERTEGCVEEKSKHGVEESTLVFEPILYQIDICKSAQESVGFYLEQLSEGNRRAAAVVELLSSREKILAKGGGGEKVTRVEQEINESIIRRDEHTKVLHIIGSILRKDLIRLFEEKRDTLQSVMSSFLVLQHDASEGTRRDWARCLTDSDLLKTRVEPTRHCSQPISAQDSPETSP